MPIPIRQRLPCPDPRFEILVTDDGSRTLIRSDGDVAYHSGCGAVAESEVVYLQNSGLADRLAEPDPRPLNLLEIGIGLGINGLLAIDASRWGARPLRYVGIEYEPLSADVLRDVLTQTDVGDAEDRNAWLDHWENFANPAIEEVRWRPHQRAEIRWYRQDARQWLPPYADDDEGSAGPDERFHIIFFDPFDPATNPELWTSSCFGLLRKIAADEAVLVTYCVKSTVRRAATEAGWRVTRRPGPPGGKREVMVAFAE